MIVIILNPFDQFIELLSEYSRIIDLYETVHVHILFI
jgi:hypothetical protein